MLRNDTVVADIDAWLTERGLGGASQEDLLEGYCSRLVSEGLPIQRVHVAQNALHPQFGGIGFDWYKDTGVIREHYEHHDTTGERWLRSPLYHMMVEKLTSLRLRVDDPRVHSKFPIIDDLFAKGATDYFACSMPFVFVEEIDSIDPNNPPEGLMISWTCDQEGGFADAEIGVLTDLMPPLGLALKASSDRQMAEDLLKVYLGADAGARVLSGEIQRGSLETIHAVVWYFDLQGFTRLSENTSPKSIISMLNDYFGAVVAVVDAHGGNVLKFMGDGLLAIFSFEDQQNASRSAVEAAHALRGAISEVNRRRRADGLPCTGFNLALHSGDVLYGNIGGESRLDFTIIGPAVNATSRILGMCNPLEQDIILSSRIADAVANQRDDVVSLGRYMLRGVPEPRELFTLYDPPEKD